MKTARSDYKTCKRCGASLDVGERCECEKQARRVEKVLDGFAQVWTGSKLDRDSIESRLLGAQIVGVYPLCNITASGRKYAVGLSIAYRRLGSKTVETVDIQAGEQDVEDQIGVVFTDGYVEPEELAFV